MDLTKEAELLHVQPLFILYEVEIITYSPPLPAWSQVR